MKQKDIIVVVAIAIVSAIFSYVIANFIFGGEKAYKLTAPTVDPISSEFKLPDERYFNKDSLNPTKDITIGDSNNSAPFNKQ
jgi:archaellin